ncbi:transposase [Alicyclobacillus sendaiensis]|uniref:transposase n=1 Tax=Alicyclobacillus sendaiensis TaxID=192387 RepID=UPI0026F459EC|nr:transposase [Alicyclobacillus sendaiensis]
MEIARTGNDIVAKHLTTALAGEVLSVIGIHNARVVRALPTELPKVEVRQEFTDIMLELADGRLLHLEFQTTREPNLYRFGAYDWAIAERYKRPIRTVVLYTRDVTEAPQTLDAGSMQYTVENVYLGRLDGDAALETVKRHLAAHEWTEEDRVRLAFAFYMRFERRTRDEAFEEIVEVVQRVPDVHEQNYLAALILGFSGRVMADEQKEQLRRVLEMTDFLKELEKEFVERGEWLKAREIANNLLAEGVPTEVIEKATGLSREELEELKKRLH